MTKNCTQHIRLTFGQFLHNSAHMGLTIIVVPFPHIRPHASLTCRRGFHHTTASFTRRRHWPRLQCPLHSLTSMMRFSTTSSSRLFEPHPPSLLRPVLVFPPAFPGRFRCFPLLFPALVLIRWGAPPSVPAWTGGPPPNLTGIFRPWAHQNLSFKRVPFPSFPFPPLSGFPL